MIDSLGGPGSGVVVREPFRVAWYSRPSGGERGGDRIAAAPDPEGGLRFYVADATGHGELGAGFWRRNAAAFDEAWVARGDLRSFVLGMNDRLAAAGEQLCLAAGRLDPAGGLSFVVHGYGVHVLGAGPPVRRFGPKLGWFESSRWGPGGYVEHVATGVRRVIVISDGWLGDDFADPPATLRLVEAMGEALRDVPLEDLAARAFEIGDVRDDDLSLLGTELFSSRAAPVDRLLG